MHRFLDAKVLSSCVIRFSFVCFSISGTVWSVECCVPGWQQLVHSPCLFSSWHGPPCYFLVSFFFFFVCLFVYFSFSQFVPHISPVLHCCAPGWQQLEHSCCLSLAPYILHLHLHTIWGKGGFEEEKWSDLKSSWIEKINVELFFVKKKRNLLFQTESSLFISRTHQKKAPSISYMDQKQQNQEGNVNDSSLKLPLVLLEPPDTGSGSSDEA